VGIGCAAQLVCIFVFNALTVVYNRYMQRAPPIRMLRDPVWTAATPGLSYSIALPAHTLRCPSRTAR